MNYTDRDDLVATMRRVKACVLIPTYNNAGTLKRVISDVLDYAADVIVVNDGSTDTTADILREFADKVTVESYPVNKGKGHALKTGFKKAREAGYDYAITIDSDGQHYPADLPKFVQAIAEHPGALIVGERDLTKVDINGKSSFANKFSNFWFRVQTCKKLNDTQTGYRAYPLKRLRGTSLLTSRYEAELELLVFAAWHGVEILSIPIKVYYPPQAERVSHFRPALDFTRISILNTFLCAIALVYGLPVATCAALRSKRLFNRECKLFTHKKGSRKEAATTLGRLTSSIYGLCFFLFWTMGAFTPFSMLYFSIGKNTDAKRYRFHKMLRWIADFLTKRFPWCNTVVDNAVGETFERPALVICNHQSHLDLPVLMSLTPKLIFLTNDWVWNNPFYGRIIHNAEFLPVSEGMEEILPKLKNLRDRGYSIVVFPEGTRSADCRILRFRQGAFHLAKELDVDILPMVLHGVGHYLPKEDFMFRKGEISLKLLDRVKASQLTDLAFREQASLFRKQIRSEYDAIADKKERAAYFRPLVGYKYAWRGWSVVARSKKTLMESLKHDDLINADSRHSRVAIVNSGIGTFALLYALANKHTEVVAYESCLADHEVASKTACLPPNLRFVHAVWESEYHTEDAKPDLTIVLDSSSQSADSNELHLPLRS